MLPSAMRLEMVKALFVRESGESAMVRSIIRGMAGGRWILNPVRILPPKMRSTK